MNLAAMHRDVGAERLLEYKQNERTETPNHTNTQATAAQLAPVGEPQEPTGYSARYHDGGGSHRCGDSICCWKGCAKRELYDAT